MLRLAAGTLALVFLVVLVFLIGSFILVRTSRRYRSATLRKKPPPTPTPDIWSMHKVPDELDFDPLADQDEDREEDEFGPKDN